MRLFAFKVLSLDEWLAHLQMIERCWRWSQMASPPEFIFTGTCHDARMGRTHGKVRKQLLYLSLIGQNNKPTILKFYVNRHRWQQRLVLRNCELLQQLRQQLRYPCQLNVCIFCSDALHSFAFKGVSRRCTMHRLKNLHNLNSSAI